jgi:diacylglycerol kinase family enzyme
MRAAAIFGPGSSEKDLKPFQNNSNVTWLIGMPAGSKEADAVLIFGGDGTVHRYLERLVKLRLPVLIVPRGSGNDFARALNLKKVRDVVGAWRKFVSGENNVRAIDLGVITSHVADPELLKLGPSPTSICDANEAAEGAGKADSSRLKPFGMTRAQQPLARMKAVNFVVTEAPEVEVGSGQSCTGDLHYFCCVAGVGLDGEIARRANKLPRWLRAHGGYAFTLPHALFCFAPFPMKTSIPDIAQPHGFVERTAKPTILAAFANAPSYGGGMKIAPQAKLDDGQLDICLITDIDKFKLFCLFPTVYFGRHLGIPEVEYRQAPAVRVETEHPLDVYADGEYVCQTPVEVGVARAALRVIVL